MKHLSLLTIGLIFTINSFGQILKIQIGPSLSALDWKIDDMEIGYNSPRIGYSAMIGLEYIRVC